MKAQLWPQLQPEQDACNAIVVCSNPFYTPAAYIGVGFVNDLQTTPCASFFTTAGEYNSMWLRVNVVTSGSLVFKIIPNIGTDDIDFAVVNITNTTCSNLLPGDVVRCNFNGNNPGSNINGVVGVWYTGTANFAIGGNSGNSFCAPVYAAAGESYLIMINTYGNYPPYPTANPFSGFTVDFTGSTATFYDGENPTFSTVLESCIGGSQQITLQMSELIQCSSVEPGGSDFSLSGGVGITSATGQNCFPNSSDKIILNFVSPLAPGNYTLTAQTGTDANTVLDMCGNPLLLPESISFTIAPPLVAFETIDTPGCSEVRIRLTRRVRCDSIAIDGSDFTITGPSAAPIVAAYGIGCDTMNFTDTVVLLLQSPIQTDGVYTIGAKKGTDGNTLVDSCGNSQAVGDAITMTINSYDGLIVSSSDSVLCEGVAFVEINADNYAQPPLLIPECGPTPLPCNGPVTSVYIGAKDSTTDINSPFYGLWHDTRAQYLYRAGELRAMGLKAGSIQTLEWKVTEKNATLPYQGFTIKIGCTSSNTLTGPFQNVQQVVYSTPAYYSVQGWNRFDLAIPYNWDGVSNLIVEVCFNNTGSSANDKVAHSIAGANSVLRRFGNNLVGCTITNQGNAQSWSNIRPKLRFSICQPASGPLNYAWTPGTLLSDSTVQQPTALISSNTTFHVTTIDRFGCAHRDSTAYIVSIRNPLVTPVESTICLDEQVQLEATGGVFYNWLAADPATLSCLSCPDPLATPYETSVYNVIISDQYCSDTLDATITVNPHPNVRISPGDTIVRYGTQLQLIGTGASLYSWSPSGALTHPGIYNPVATVNGPLVIILNGIDSNGCINTDTLNINVDYHDPVFIPSAFSPNNDGRNDVFRVGSLSFQRLLEFRIFNRWGQEVFSTTDPKGGWNGEFKGVMQETGVYHYIIRIAYPDGRVDNYKGDVTLVK